MSTWTELRPGLYRYPDSCAVYAFMTSKGAVIINAGTGAWMDSLTELPAQPHCLILTHFFRDHTSGAPRASAAGIPVWASYWEQEQLADSTAHFSRRETYIIYDNSWDLFAPIENVSVARWLKDWESIPLGDTELMVVPTPGASLGALSIHARRGSESGVFCGEIIHSPGKVPRVAPLQYNYNDFDGAPNLLYSIGQIRALDPDWIAGSLAPDLIEDVTGALDLLSQNVTAALKSRGGYEKLIESATADELEEITPHLYRSKSSVASNYFLVSSSGKVLAIDYGYRAMNEVYAGLGVGGSYAFPRHRRPLLHGIEPLRSKVGSEHIDAVLVTHFHDDHINGIPMLQRLHGTKCYAAETFAFILRDPDRYAFPCTWPEPIDVTAIPVDRPFTWEEYEFTLSPISGHTRYSTLIGFRVDGEQVVATGDQFFFQDLDHPGTGPGSHNHVYRNGAVLSSFAESSRILKDLNPTIILPGHGPGYRVSEQFFDWIDKHAQDYERIHTTLMPLADDEVHFDVDSRAVWLEPYRVRVDHPTSLNFVAHVRNPYPQEATLGLRLVLPADWTSESVTLQLAPREEGVVPLSAEISPGTVCRRQPIALELTGPDQLFGQVAEALVTVGHPRF